MTKKLPQAELARPLWKRALHRAGILTGTALVGVLAVGLTIGTTQQIAANSVRITQGEDRPPLTVATIPVVMQNSYDIPQSFLGQVEPQQEADLGFELSGKVEHIYVDEGDYVTKGSLLAELDRRVTLARLKQLRASRDALQAQLELAELTETRQQALADRSFASQQRADEARLAVTELKARLAGADAAITETEVQLQMAEIRAPFDGRISARYVDDGTRVTASAPVIDLLAEDAPRLRIGISSTLANSLTPGDQFEAWIDGQAYKVQLDGLRSDLDPVTRTISAMFTLEPVAAQTKAPAFGSVVRLQTLRTVQDQGLWLPLSALTEGPRGLWTVYIVADAENGQVVAREAVELLYADETRAFVRGAFQPGQEVIADGPHRVAVGQYVQTIDAKG
ncbi:MAG: efflux RND transporter periplasmic adaptor subunit [Mangrovicoccus sp.]